MLEKALESPLDYKQIQTVHPKGDQSWVFIGRTDVEAETPIFWAPFELWCWTIYCISNMAETGQPFVLSEANIIIKSKYPASGILDKLTT